MRKLVWVGHARLEREIEAFLPGHCIPEFHHRLGSGGLSIGALTRLGLGIGVPIPIRRCQDRLVIGTDVD
jgi:hypothetical protein